MNINNIKRFIIVTKLLVFDAKVIFYFIFFNEFHEKVYS